MKYSFIDFLKEIVWETKDLCYWIKNRKAIQKEIEESDKQYSNLLIQLRKARKGDKDGK